jgi:hypothetical protein
MLPCTQAKVAIERWAPPAEPLAGAITIAVLEVVRRSRTDVLIST